MNQELCARTAHVYRRIIMNGHQHKINVADNRGRLIGNMMTSVGWMVMMMVMVWRWAMMTE